MMGRNSTHHSIPSVQDHGSRRSRSPSRKSQYQTERSYMCHRNSHKDSSPPNERYSTRPKFPKDARPPSPYYPFPQAKRLGRAEAGGVPETEQERINGRKIGRNFQEDGGSDRKEKISGRNVIDGKFSRSWHGTSSSDRDRRSRHRHVPQRTGDTRDEEKVIEGHNRNHSRWIDRSMHREYKTERMERMTAEDSWGHLSSRSRHTTSSDQQHRSRDRSYSPQHFYDTRHGKKVIQEHEQNHGRVNHISMHMEYDTERMERMMAKESTSYRSSRPMRGSPSDRNHKSRYSFQLPQHTVDIRVNEKVIMCRERNYSRGNYRSIHRENDTDRTEWLTAKENTVHRFSRSIHGHSPSDRHWSTGDRYNQSLQHADDTRDEEKVIGGCQRNNGRGSYRNMHKEYETERIERRTAKDCSSHWSSRSGHGQLISPLDEHHKNGHRTHFTGQAADSEAHNEQKISFELSGNLAVEGSRFRGDGLKKKLISSNENDGEKHYDNERTQVICTLNLAPRKKKLLVFDLNGLLVYRAFCFNTSVIPRDRAPDGKCGNHLVFKRPFAEEFMLFCLERFEVGIWTSALEKNVDGVLDCLMEKLRSRLIFVWDQHQCTDSGFKSLEKKMKPLFFKDLKKVWDQFKGKFSASDTLLIDDQPYKALLNPPYSGIFLDPYVPDNGSDNALDPKKELGEYLSGLAVADDVQLYVKQNPFGLPAISSRHPDWNFYSAVIRKLGKYL
ncbi:uncharacterized protein LOC126797713 [Argentina anserina]|uniref:uncharacterized protein LOC126797713 n=1 Tax=Argentina anserina TaxID=57926 RepID=UPI0021762F05|nr:uncharacterized protein LOC126797713 [Potentilla anserina]XP_050380373.1 uncharacterized protein LOC126797713 [Potentilla anserina]XP_050380374.1 uncharacterized protein LOC126797713 [Potentilla anserina]